MFHIQSSIVINKTIDTIIVIMNVKNSKMIRRNIWYRLTLYQLNSEHLGIILNYMIWQYPKHLLPSETFATIRIQYYQKFLVSLKVFDNIRNNCSTIQNIWYHWKHVVYHPKHLLLSETVCILNETTFSITERKDTIIRIVVIPKEIFGIAIETLSTVRNFWYH